MFRDVKTKLILMRGLVPFTRVIRKNDASAERRAKRGALFMGLGRKVRGKFFVSGFTIKT